MIELMELTDKGISALTDIADLEDKGHRIVDVLGGDVTPAQPTQELIDRLTE